MTAFTPGKVESEGVGSSDSPDVLSDLARARMLFQLRAVCAAMGIPQPTALDMRPDKTGLDDGPYLPGSAPRKLPDAKSPAEHAAIKARAWATRKQRYGEKGHS